MGNTLYVMQQIMRLPQEERDRIRSLARENSLVTTAGPVQREKSRKYTTARKIRLAKSTSRGSHTAKEWQDLCEKYDFSCVCCKKRVGFDHLERDHVIPVAHGGSSGIDNIQPLCESCNARKGTKHTDYRTS